jgi:hypothetical protein
MLTQLPGITPDVLESRILSRVRKFVQEFALYRQRGFVLAEDSRYVGAMVKFLEAEFGIGVSSSEITEANLGSLRAVAHFVARKRPDAVA